MFVRAVYYREKKTVHYFDENGAETLYIGGSFAWRMNNPGNMAKPGKRVVHDVIGYAQRTSDPKSLFLIFKDRAAGERERMKLMREVYGKSTISEMMHRYAPPHENDTAGYIAFICKRANVKADDVVGKLSEKQFNDVVAAIGKHEGYAPGKIVELGKPAKAELRDVAQQPIANQPVQVKSGEHVLDTKTNRLGELPPLYPDLFKLDLSFYHAAMADQPEKIGMLAPSAFSSDVTFVAPYFVLQSQPKVHETKHPERPSVHVVRAGQTLSKIAAMYPGLTAEAIARENNLKDVNKIFERQHLRLPGGSATAPAAATPPAAPAKPAAPPP
ncbi:LysM peptidoglycan-binding domain-containing protein, partial [Pseudoduganella buxea]